MGRMIYHIEVLVAVILMTMEKILNVFSVSIKTEKIEALSRVYIRAMKI